MWWTQQPYIIILYAASILPPIPLCTGLSVVDLAYDNVAVALTCISRGRPIDSVTWFKDGSEIRGNSSVFSQNQTITDRMDATYQHILSSESATHFVGTFTCVVRDGSGIMATRTLALNGEGVIGIGSAWLNELPTAAVNVSCTTVQRLVPWCRSGHNLKLKYSCSCFLIKSILLFWSARIYITLSLQ